MDRKKNSASSNIAFGLIGAAVGVIGALLVKEVLSDDKPKQVEPIKAKSIKNDSKKGLCQDIFCPITQEPMSDPYIIKNCGHSFQKNVIYDYVGQKKQCPLCRVPCKTEDLIPNYSLKNIIENLMKTQQ